LLKAVSAQKLIHFSGFRVDFASKSAIAPQNRSDFSGYSSFFKKLNLLFFPD
jgi:hypothetical protein